MTAVEKLIRKNNDGKFICVGLDSDIQKIPALLRDEEFPLFEFNKNIIEAVSDYAAAFKINFAFYESSGIEGFRELQKTISLIPKDVLIIADAKRGDIGNTSQKYAESVFGYFKCDAITVNPYMGTDSVEPFLSHHEKLIFILALTSNPGAQDFEKLVTSEGKFVYEEVIEKVNRWNTSHNCGIVFGATKIEELKASINSFGDLAVLLPGVGAQGGSLTEVVETFRKANRRKFLINVSRGIIYKDSSSDYAAAAAAEMMILNAEVNSLWGSRAG